MLTATTRKLASMTQGRKFHSAPPKKNIEQRKKESPCAACGEYGHWVGESPARPNLCLCGVQQLLHNTNDSSQLHRQVILDTACQKWKDTSSPPPITRRQSPRRLPKGRQQTQSLSKQSLGIDRHRAKGGHVKTPLLEECLGIHPLLLQRQLHDMPQVLRSLAMERGHRRMEVGWTLPQNNRSCGCSNRSLTAPTSGASRRATSVDKVLNSRSFSTSATASSDILEALQSGVRRAVEEGAIEGPGPGATRPADLRVGRRKWLRGDKMKSAKMLEHQPEVQVLEQTAAYISKKKVDRMEPYSAAARPTDSPSTRLTL